MWRAQERARISQQLTQLNLRYWNKQIIKNLSVEKETLLTVPGFEPGSFDCESAVLTNLAR